MCLRDNSENCRGNLVWEYVVRVHARTAYNLGIMRA
eukprot:SAG22_NODE_1876_length_3387_cov_3.762470_2_plen_36_part_00